MGKRGPKPKEIGESFGWRDRRRRREAAAAKVKPRPKSKVKPWPVDRDEVKAAIKSLPGYDPKANWGEAEFWFDVDEAVERIEFFHHELQHCKGPKADQPFNMEPWQQGVIANLFGWKRKVDGIEMDIRRFREALLFVPRKNGKTPMAAAIILCILDMDNEPGAEIYGAAAEYQQASKVFEYAWGSLLRNADLAERYQVFKGQAKAIQSIADPLTYYRVLSSDASTKHGENTHAAVIDELHALPTGELVDVLATSTAAREQPLLLYITTSDFEREGSVCNEKHDYASKVRDGVVIDPMFLPVIYEATVEDDWKDEAVWRKANPNLGVSVGLDHIRRECKHAQEAPSSLNRFLRLHLNIRTEQDVQAITLADWDACDEVLDLDELEGKPCWCGLDLASKRDFTAFVMIFPYKDGYAWVPRLWLPKDNIRKRQDHKIVDSIMQWVEEGLIELTPGNVTDYDAVRRRICELGEQYDIQEIAFDRWGATQITVQLEANDFTVKEFGQGYRSFAGPTKELVEKLVPSRQIYHDGHAVLRWMISNLMVEMDAAGNLKPSKRKSGGQIDAVVAGIMGLKYAMLRPQEDTTLFEDGVTFV